MRSKTLYGAMQALLREDVVPFLDDRSDVNADGNANEAMSLAQRVEELLARPDPMAEIERRMDEQPWSADTLDSIADVLRRAGYAVRDVRS